MSGDLIVWINLCSRKKDIYIYDGMKETFITCHVKYKSQFYRNYPSFPVYFLDQAIQK